MSGLFKIYQHKSGVGQKITLSKKRFWLVRTRKVMSKFGNEYVLDKTVVLTVEIDVAQ